MQRRDFLKASTSIGAAAVPGSAGGATPPTPAGTRVFVRDFGAKGDGVTDDTPAIQAALDSGARAVYLPAARYLVGSLVAPSNLRLHGDGPHATVLVHKRGMGGAMIATRGETENVALEGFSMEGNAAVQTKGAHCGIRLDAGAARCRVTDVHASDFADWTFCVYGSHITLHRCEGSGISGATGPNAVRAVFLIGASRPKRNVDDILLDQCVARDCPLPYSDGFILESGAAVTMSNCRVRDVSYTGIKIKTNDTRVMGCHVQGCLTGIQTQGALRQLSLVSNTAMRNGGAGFQFNQHEPDRIAHGWLVTGNAAIENGQNAAGGTPYGFAFENVERCVTNGLVVSNNISMDGQKQPTQIRGLSFGKAGVYSNVLLAGNLCSGNQVDFVLGLSLELDSLLRDTNAAKSTAAYGTGAYRLNAWTSEATVRSQAFILADCNGNRGFLVTRPGFLRYLCAKASTPVTAGSATFSVRVNGAFRHRLSCRLDSTNPVFQIAEQPPFEMTLAPGDVITIACVIDKNFAAASAAGFDAVVEICY